MVSRTPEMNLVWDVYKAAASSYDSICSGRKLYSRRTELVIHMEDIDENEVLRRHTVSNPKGDKEKPHRNIPISKRHASVQETSLPISQIAAAASARSKLDSTDLLKVNEANEDTGMRTTRGVTWSESSTTK